MQRMSSEEPSRSVDVVQAECGSQFVHFLSQYLLYLLLTFKTGFLNNRKLFLINDIHHS